MKIHLRVLVLVATLTCCAIAQDSPRMKTVEPGNGKVGDELTVAGENLDTKFVREVYLTDGKNDIKVEVTQQTSETIKLKIPPRAKPGRYSLMVLTTEKPPKLIEQPVRCTVD